nr:uncharacterized protein LOC100338622 [Oryctolagus cuniculus]
MELQSRPEALAVELARRQNGDLRKQLQERPARVAALGDKQVSAGPPPGVGAGRAPGTSAAPPGKCGPGLRALGSHGGFSVSQS